MNMPAWFNDLDPILQAFAAGGFTWLLTAVGATMVFGLVSVPRKLFDAMLGFVVMMVLDVSLG